MSEPAPAYGLWVFVAINSAVFIFFALSFFKPQNTRDWRCMSAFSAFVVALFVEMYGFPLTIFLLSGWLGRHYPVLDPMSHEAGHLWSTLLGLEGDPHFAPLHILGNLLVVGGFMLIATAWSVLHAAQRVHVPATTGPYAWVRHPQYLGFIVIMVGFLLQWPTLLTLLMFPVLVVMYVRLARAEEREEIAAVGEPYRRYLARTPAWIPNWPHRRETHEGGGHA